jgi:hypothetical protein
MVPFNPHDWTGGSGWPGHRHDDKRRPEELNREVVLRWLMAAAFCLCFAALGPPHLILHGFAGLQFVAALVSAMVAAFRREDPSAPHLTSWDEAAFSLLVSLGLQIWLGPPPSA